MNMKADRWPRKVYAYDKMCGNKGWLSDLYRILVTLHLPLPSDFLYELKSVESAIKKVSEDQWWNEMLLKPKLDKFAEVKVRGELNTLACGNLKRYNRSLLAKLVCGILPLEVETGRYARKWDKEKKKFVKIPREERFCTLCPSGKVEDEYHFLFACTALKNVRDECYAQYIQDVEGFKALPDREKFKLLLNKDMIKKTGFFVENLFSTRRTLLYKPS